MKKLLITLSLCLSAVLAYADNGWKTDFEAALDEAKTQNKYVLVNFTGSDWCGWCIKLKKEVFSKDAFKQFADAELVLVEIDFPNGKEQSESLKDQNKKLAEKYAIEGFPTIIILSPNQEVVARTGYREGGAEAYVAYLKKLIGK